MIMESTARTLDTSFQLSMLLEAAYPPSHPKPDAETALLDPRIAQWVEGFGERHGDLYAVACQDGKPVGAAWCRLFDEKPVTGVVGLTGVGIPSLAIATDPGFRGMGIGTMILLDLCHKAEEAGFCSLSLCVGRSNPAVRMYVRCGFEVVEERGTLLVMVRRLRTKAPILAESEL